jgi:hypothetical protein
VRFVDLSDGNPLENFQRRWSGNGESAMGARNRAVPVVQARDVDLLDAQCFDPDARADNIRDGIECADFVKLHVFRRLTMNLSLGDRHALEDGQSVLLHERRQLAVLDQFANLAMAAPVLVTMRMFSFMHFAAVVVVMFMTVGMAVGMTVVVLGVSMVMMLLAGFV